MSLGVVLVLVVGAVFLAPTLVLLGAIVHNELRWRRERKWHANPEARRNTRRRP